MRFPVCLLHVERAEGEENFVEVYTCERCNDKERIAPGQTGSATPSLPINRRLPVCAPARGVPSPRQRGKGVFSHAGAARERDLSLFPPGFDFDVVEGHIGAFGEALAVLLVVAMELRGREAHAQ